MQHAHLWPTQFADPVHTLTCTAHDTPLVLAGSYGGALEVWTTSEDNVHDVQCTRVASLPDAHTRSITAIGTTGEPNSAHIFVTGSADASLKVWHVRDGNLPELEQTLPLGVHYPLAVAVVQLPKTKSLLMAVALTDRRIVLYVRDDQEPFALRCRLDAHEDWVRALDFAVAQSDVYLASAAQDQSIRIWRFQPHGSVELREATGAVGGTQATTTEPSTQDDKFDAMARELLPDGIATRKHWLDVGSTRWAVSLDALLLGHDAWVTDVRWAPSNDTQPANLLSCSADHSVILWSPDAEGALGDVSTASALWLPQHRLGDVGSASGGFLGVRWIPSASGNAVLAHDRQGATHLWTRMTGTARIWEPLPALSGHLGAARGVAWEPFGDYLLTAGADRTMRLHGTAVAHAQRSWHELARPQTHGYEVQDAAWVDRATYVSAADEKVLRVFAAPRAFATQTHAIGTVQTHVRRAHVLAIEISEWSGAGLAAPLAAAMHDSPDALEVLVYAASLRPIVDGTWPENVSLGEVECFLQRVYTAAWGEAVATDNLLVDINVYLIPAASINEAARLATLDWAMPVRITRVFALEDEAYAVHPQVLSLLGPAETLALGPRDVTAVNASTAPAPCKPTVALGGTFDHLHIGHKLLLSIAALCATKHLIVGVTDTALLTNKKHRNYVESLSERLAAVRRFVRAFRSTLAPISVEAVPISDVCGPAGTRAELDLLVLTEETARGGDVIAQTRVANGVPPVDVYTVRLVDAAGETGTNAAHKLGSTAIRGWLEQRGTDLRGCAELDADLAQVSNAPATAHVPPLGLSNRAVAATDANAKEVTDVPNSEALAQTLWPELEKLYGHGYELLAVACDLRTRLVASSCKATTAAHAVVRLFDGADRWRPLPPLEGHTLSITRVQFSADGQYLLTASRDRSWRLFRRDADGTFVPLAGERAHARIVWDCAWSPRPSSHLFATASRDKTVRLWRIDERLQERPYAAVASIVLDDAATAVAIGANDTLAIGLECGDLLLYVRQLGNTWTLHDRLDRHHTGVVNDVAFRPAGAWQDDYNEVCYHVLSAGDDGCVRLVSWSV